MHTLVFTATQAFPKWVQKKGGFRDVEYQGKVSKQPFDPVVLEDGDSFEMDDFDSQWCLVHYPQNFQEV